MDIAATLRRHAAERPGKVALVAAAEGARITFSELDREVDRVASGLVNLGVAPGDRVAILMQNVPHFAYAYLGALRAGAVVVPLNIMYTPVEMARILNDSEVKVLFASEQFAGSAREAAASVASLDRVISTESWAELGELGATVKDAALSKDDLAVLAYTSGTTGEPKGAMLTHGNLQANVRQQLSIPGAEVSADDVLFIVLPLFHIFGLNVCLGLLVSEGATGILVDRFDPVPTLELIQNERVSILFGAPTMYSAWVNTPGGDQYDLSSVRMAISGAAPLQPETLQAFKDIFGVTIYEGYGLTETAPTLASNRVAGEPRSGSIGMPLPEVELRLVDEEGNDVELGDTGEIVVRGPNVFKGYWRRPEETERAFFGDWFRTGDVAVMDEEGYLYLVDRKRDLIIVSGFNVFPSEVEEALLANPAVEEAAAIGVPHPYTGEAVKAYVVLRRGHSATEAELLEDVSDRLARFKCPQSIEIVDDLPHLLTGKVLRRALRT